MISSVQSNRQTNPSVSTQDLNPDQTQALQYIQQLQQYLSALMQELGSGGSSAKIDELKAAIANDAQALKTLIQNDPNSFNGNEENISSGILVAVDQLVHIPDDDKIDLAYLAGNIQGEATILAGLVQQNPATI